MEKNILYALEERALGIKEEIGWSDGPKHPMVM
jgi:hypothetical protein